MSLCNRTHLLKDRQNQAVCSKGHVYIPPHNTVLERRSTAPGMECMAMKLVVGTVPQPFRWARNICGQAGVPRRQPREQELGRTHGWCVTPQWWHSRELRRSPWGSPPWCPEAQCTGGGRSYWGRMGVMCRKEWRVQASRQWCRHTVVEPGALSCRMQMGKPKELFHWTHFPFSFLCISLFYIMSGWKCCDNNCLTFNMCNLHSTVRWAESVLT